MTKTNNVKLVGYAGANPELVELKNNRYKKATLSLATNESYKKNGEWFKVTTWHKVVAWNNTAAKMCELIQKGSRLSINGKVNYRQVQTDKGTMTLSEILVNDFTIEPSK
jgi:single-strand DNA-binding protein